MASLRKPSAKDKAKELRAKIDAGVETLAKAVDAVRASEEFKRYLDVQARFHKYSWHNCMLILSQCPNASRIAGYRTWQSMGRQVKKGERGLMIFAPRTFKKEVETSSGETEERAGLYFRPVHVFDVGQTDGEALPEIDVPDVETASDDLLAKLQTVATSRGIVLNFAPIDGGVYGASKNGKIDVDNTHSTGQQAKTLAHELAHETMHWLDKSDFTRSLAELEAESVAYVVCRHFGLDVEVRASRYIAMWDGDAKALRESLDRIAKTARGIIDDAEASETRKAVA